MKSHKIVAVSGGFDPLHAGHVRMFNAAKELGDELVVILNNDNWLTNKKGYVFMVESEREEVLKSLRAVDRVVLTDHQLGEPDQSVNRELRKVCPDIFANGGDRNPGGVPIPEVKVCEELGIEMVYNIGEGGKIQSSSWLSGAMIGRGALKVADRIWGKSEILCAKPHYWAKTIKVAPGKRLSLQVHQHRDEAWVGIEGQTIAEIEGNENVIVAGDVAVVRRGQQHRLSSKVGGTIIEVASGDCVVEDDITRIEDDHGRV